MTSDSNTCFERAIASDRTNKIERAIEGNSNTMFERGVDYMLKEDLIKECSELFKVHPRDLMGKYRFAFVVRARHALYLALRKRGWSYPRIGRFMDRDHSSVIHGVKQAQHRAEHDPEYAAKIQTLVTLTPVILEMEEQDDDTR